MKITGLVVESHEETKALLAEARAEMAAMRENAQEMARRLGDGILEQRCKNLNAAMVSERLEATKGAK